MDTFEKLLTFMYGEETGKALLPELRDLLNKNADLSMGGRGGPEKPY